MKRDMFDAELSKVLTKIQSILLKKGQDYSGNDDRFRNMRLMGYITCGKPIVITPLVSCLIRKLDKMQRAINLIMVGENAVDGERLEDALLDDIGYGLIAYLIHKSEQLKDKECEK